MKRLFDMDLRVCGSLEDHFEAIRAYIDDAKDKQSDRARALEEEIAGLEFDLKEAEYDRDTFEDRYENAEKQLDKYRDFIHKNGLESKLKEYCEEQNMMN